MSKETILNKLRANVRETYEMPDLSFRKLTFADPVAEYIKQTTTTAGAKLIEAKEGDNLSELIRQAYPEATVISTNVEVITAESLCKAYGRQVELRNPDTVETAQQLDGTDVGVLQGGVACAENACVWIPQTMKERAVCFISEYLVILTRRTSGWRRNPAENRRERRQNRRARRLKRRARQLRRRVIYRTGRSFRVRQRPRT